MLKNRRRALVAASIACVLPLALSAAVAPVQAASGTSSAHAATTGKTAGLAYVALGDSYASGYGLDPQTGLPVPGCGQSSQDYPHQVAAALGLVLTDVTCSSAVIADLTGAQATGNGTAAPQDSALTADTRVVTLTIGGNDLGFESITAYCVALSPDGPLLMHPSESSCHSHFTEPGPDNLQERLAATGSPACAATLTDIRRKAPHAAVFVIGYPAIAPNPANTPASGCFRSSLGIPLPTDGYPFTTTDVPFLLQTEQELDTALRTDTLAAGYTFVPTLQATLAHTPCAASTEPAGTPWMNGLSLASFLPPSLQPGALHPDQAGVDYMATQLSAAIKAAFAPPPVKTARPAPTATGSSSGGLSAPVLALVIALAAAAVAAAALLVRRRIRANSMRR